jgi:predicted O-methyltransferase YrrM
MNIHNIEAKYNLKKSTHSDINEHLDTLYKYALKCDTIAEFGVRNVVSSYAFAHARPKELLCLDIDNNGNVDTFINECKLENINASFVHDSSTEYELTHDYDLLFIDTLHTFEQLTKELEKHHRKITKYIIFHDTIFWGHKNENPIDSSDTGERGDNVGLVPAIGNFLKTHKEWKEVATYTNNNGLTILERKLEPYLVYRDVLVGQTKTTPELLTKIIKENNFDLIIEIGTHRGGLSLWLNDNKPSNCDFYTVDITSEHLKINIEKENIKFLLGDCFTTQFQPITDLIKNHKQVLLICDGGNKENEFKTFASKIKYNDVIMCHDFADDQSTYIKVQQQIGWPSGSESHMSNLTLDIQNNNLQPYLFEEAKHCFWGCFKKQ